MIPRSFFILVISINIYFLTCCHKLKNEQEFFQKNSAKLVLKNPQNKIPPPLKFATSNQSFIKTDYKEPDENLAKAGAIFILEDQKILWSKNAKTPYPIASLTKILTCLRLFEIIKKDSEINLQTKIPITSQAKKVAHSSFLKKSPYKSLSLEILMHSIMFCSANDSSKLVADYFSQKYNLPFFVQMNRLAQQNQCSSALFFNSHGLPGDYRNKRDNKISVEDMAILSTKILIENPIITQWTKQQQYKYFKETNKPFLRKNTNKLVTQLPNVTGLKTGYTINAGYCLVLSWKFQQKTNVAIILGCHDKESRTKFAKEIFLWTNHFLLSSAKK